MRSSLTAALVAICIALMLTALIACDPEPTQTVVPTSTAAPTATSIPTPTLTPEPTATKTPKPTQTPAPTRTSAPEPTVTPGPNTPLAFDPLVLRGTLSNGLSYFIRHNEEPRDRAQIALVIKAGSVHEEDSQ